MRWGRAGAGILFFCDGEVLLTLRSGRVEEPMTWGIPGGAIGNDRWVHTEDDSEEDFVLEDFWQGALKETEEELFDGDAEFDIEPFDHVVYKEGNFSYTTFLVEITSELRDSWNPVCNWECDDIKWFPTYSLPYSLNNGLHFGLKYVVKERPHLFVKNMDQSLSEINARALPVFYNFQLRESDYTFWRNGSASEFSEFTFVPKKYYYGEYYGTPRMGGERSTGFGSGQYSYCTPRANHTPVVGPRNPFIVTAKERGENPAWQFGTLAKTLMCLAETWAGVADWSRWLRTSPFHIHPSYEIPNWTEVATTPETIDDTGVMFLTYDFKKHQNGNWWRISSSEKEDYRRVKENIISACADWSIHRMVHPINIFLSRYGFDGIVWGKYTIEYADNGDFGCLLFPPITYDGELVGLNPTKRSNTYMYLPIA